MTALLVSHTAQGEEGMLHLLLLGLSAVGWHKICGQATCSTELFRNAVSGSRNFSISHSSGSSFSINVQNTGTMEESSASKPAAAEDIASTAQQLSPNRTADDPSDHRGEKRKWEGHKNKRQQQGSKRHKGRDMGRQEYLYVFNVTRESRPPTAPIYHGITNSLKSPKSRQAQAQRRRARETPEQPR